MLKSANHRCATCGAEVSAFATEGFCSACLLERGLSSSRPAKPPLSTFGDYELIEEIARGGMGVVYKARQAGLDRFVAIKMILSGQFASPAEMQRFRAEARAAAALQHPGIVAIHEVGEYEGLLFFSMDLVEGRNLAQHIRDDLWSARRAAQCLVKISEAIQYAHEHGVLHRDLKPSNVLIDIEGQSHVTDFGLAKQLSGESDLTQTGQVLGSPNFMPPEQAAGKQRELTPASDVYSLGALLYHALTGRAPFLADTIPATLRLVAESDPIAPRLLVPTVPRDLETICLKCLEKEPLRRYGTARELADELGRCLRDEPIHARPASRTEKIWRWCRRNPMVTCFAVVVVLLLLVVMIGSPIATFRIDRERRLAQAARKQAEGNEKKAATEGAKSKQVARFLQEMLRAAGPSVARGRDATILREILDKTVERVERDLKDQPEVQGDVWLVLGNTYADIGDFPRAIKMFENGTRSYRQAFRNENAKLALALGHLGRCQSFNRDVSSGKVNAGLGLKIARNCSDAETLATCLVDLAGSFASWGQSTPQSVPLLREAVALRKQLGDNPIALAKCMSRLAAAMMGIDNNEAEESVRAALALHRRYLEPNHPDIAADIFLLGQVLLDRGKLQNAEITLRETFDLYRQIFDQNHPHQPIVLRFLVESLLLQGKASEAESLVRRQVEVTPTNAGHLELLATVLVFKGDLAAAVEPVLRAVELNPVFDTVLCPLAVALLEAGRDEQYLLFRHNYLEHEAGRTNFVGNPGIAKALLLLKGDNGDFERACQFAELTITNVTKGDPYSVEPIRTLMEYRRGSYASAKEWSNRIVTRKDGWLPRVAEGWFLQAMASARLQEIEPARTAYAWGDKLFNARPKDLKGDFLMADSPWQLTRLLRREATGMIGGQSGVFSSVEMESAGKAISLARRGHWKEAAAEFAETIKSQPNDHLAYRFLAPLLVANGDIEGYRQHCGRMIAQFGRTKDPGVAGNVVICCLILPFSGVDLKAMGELADRAVTLGNPSEYLPWFQFSKGLADYRLGHFAGATNWTQKALMSAGKQRERDAAAYLVLAMAQMQLKQASVARLALRKAAEILDEKLPKLDGADLGDQWNDRIIADALMREATALMEVAGPIGPDTLKGNP